MEVVLYNLVQAQNIIEDIIPLKEKIERKINTRKLEPDEISIHNRKAQCGC